MASSSEGLSEIQEINETLYIDSYFNLLKQKNNASKAKDELRNFIRQTEMHCSFQNVSKKSTDELKSQFILEYFSITDREEQEGLLSVVTDDWNVENRLTSSLNVNFESQKAHQRCIELVQNGFNSYQEIQSESNVNLSVSNDSNFLQNQKELKSISETKQSNPRKSDLDLNRNAMSCYQSERWSRMTGQNSNATSASSTLINKSNYPQKQNINSFAENSLKRRANESNNCKSRFRKKQNICLNDKETDTQPQNTLKNSFLPATSMYKNPFKKPNDESEKNELQVNQVSDSPASSIKSHPTLKNFESKIVDIILSEIMDFSPDIKWSDIAGLEFVKSTVQEIVIWPLLRPDIFTGLRAPPRGILLFGPPGTGKTLIGKCIATESNSTFFCISASSLSSKWVGESEQLVRALFAVAQLHQPAVIFIDEIDSLLSQRSDQEQDHTRKLKTEFLVQFDGAKTNSERRVLVVGATNRPHELDEAARRRFVKRLYVPLPEKSARLQIIERLLTTHQHGLSNEDLQKICEETDGYSGSDVAHLCKEAAMGPIRSIGPDQIKTVSLDQVRPIELIDFLDALKQVRASVAQEDLNYYLDWNKKFGSFNQ